MNENVKIVFGLIGGLALFLYGMNSMSDALQKAAGEKMKKVLGFLTKNAVMGAVAGALVTAVLQSSSATTVMVIGFVSANLMSLPQAISVIFGANIGTTMTAQLMAFKISNYIYPIIFIGFIMNFICKKEKVKNIGMVLFSFGLLFEGIEIMGGVMKPLANSPVFLDWMGKVKDMPVLGVLLGAAMTLVVQSSSATIAVLQNFASQAGPDGLSVIGLTGAIPILLGDNIGTTITALLASIGQSKNAKRTAIAHSVFNITGSIVFLFLIPLLAKFVCFISPAGNEIDVISRQIANAHTTFNVVCTLVWLPLIPIMIKIVTFIVRGEDKNFIMHYDTKFLDEHVLSQPLAAMILASKEIGRLSDHVQVLFMAVQDTIHVDHVASVDEKYDSVYTGIKELQDKIALYITKMFSSGTLTERQSEQTAGLLFISNNLDRIADRCEEIEKVIKQIEQEGTGFSEEAKAEIQKCVEVSKQLLSDSMDAVIRGKEGALQAVVKGQKKLKKYEKQFTKAHLMRVKKKTCSAMKTKDYAAIMYAFERIADNCLTIADEAQDTIIFEKLEEEA